MVAGRDKGKFPLASGVAGLSLVVSGGIIYAISGELGNLPLALIWGGILLIVFFIYTRLTLIQKFVGRRSTIYGANTLVMTVVFIIILVLTAYMSVRHKVRMDLTDTGRYTLAPQTIKILRSLSSDVEAIAFYRSDQRTRQAMLDLLKEYSYYSPNFRFWFVDPDQNPLEAANYGVTSYRATLIRHEGREEVVSFESENKLTNALLKVLRKEIKRIYFVTGHGENSLTSTENVGYLAVKEALEEEHYEVRDLLLLELSQVPEDASVVVFAGAKTAPLPGELAMLTKYIRDGGKALFMLDPGDAPQLGRYLKEFGFHVGEDIIIDKLSQVFGGNYLTPVVSDYYKNHPITAEFDIATFFPMAQSVSIDEDKTLGSLNLAMTSQNSWAKRTGILDEDNLEFDELTGVAGPLNVISVTSIPVDRETVDAAEQLSDQNDRGLNPDLRQWGKIVVIGDSNFASNSYIQMAGNRDLFLNIVNWLAEEHLLISVRKKAAGLSPVTLTAVEGRMVFWVCVIILPSLVMLLGFAIISRSRSLD
jgi:ABC-type uncharacterized transport system involved in gliding motility auxiliary subunit